MKVGDLVRQKVDVRTYRVGVVLDSTVFDGDVVCHCFWSSQPFGRDKLSAAWGRDLEVLSEAR